MKKITYRNYWFTRNFFNLLMIPVTVLAIVIGVNSKIIDSELNSNNTFEWINFFDIQSNLATIIPVQPIVFNQQNSLSYSHFLILDRTNSMLKIDDNLIDSLRKSLKQVLKSEFLEKITPENNSQDPNILPDIKQLVIWYFYQKISESNCISELCPTYYDGDLYGLIPLINEAIRRPELNWFPSSNESERILLSKSFKKSLVINYKNQTTNFANIFKSIHRYSEHAKSNIILTIISDFDNDGLNVSDKDINNLQLNNRISQLNLIYLPPINPLKRRKSEKLLTLLRSHFESTNNYLELNLDNFSDSLYTDESFEHYKIKSEQSLSSFNYSKDNVFLYHPKEHEKGLIVAKCNLILKAFNITDTVNWRISSAFPSLNPELFFGNFKINPNSNPNPCSFVVDGSWTQFPQKGDTLMLEFTHFPDWDTSNLYFDVYNKGQTIRYKIKFKQIMEEKTAIFGHYCLQIILFIFCFLFILHLWRKFDEHRHNRTLFNYKYSTWREALSLSISLFFLCFSIYFKLNILIKLITGAVLLLHTFAIIFISRVVHLAKNSNEAN